MQKARRHRTSRLRQLVSIPVSGAISLPSGVLSPFPHGTSSLSVAKEVLSLAGGPPGSDGFPVPGRTQELQKRGCAVSAYGAVTRCGVQFHALRLPRNFVTRRPAGRRSPEALQPATTTAAAYHVATVWADPFFARHYSGSRVSFLSSGYLDVFSSPACLCTICIQVRVHRITSGGFPHFGNPGVKGWSAPHPGLSQPPTSFFGSWRQGIHRNALSLFDREELASYCLWSFQGGARTASALPRTTELAARSLQTSTAFVEVDVF